MKLVSPKAKTVLTIALAAAFHLAVAVPATAFAQDRSVEGYLVDTNGRIVPSAFGLCWRDSEWTVERSAAACEPVTRVALPAPVIVVTPAAPVAAAPPQLIAPLILARPVIQKISFSADALFAFDKSELKPEGRLMLDGLVRQLKGVTDDGIVLTGHTDRFGTDAYNQKLSERRANSVKDYLVAQGLPARSIDAVGKGEAQPETRPGDCKGNRSAKVIACLQPDRRVDVEMIGNKTVTQAR